jgi:HSP20 family protein
MNLVRFNHPGFTNIFDHMDKCNNGHLNESKGNIPSVNIIENDDDFLIELSVPGLKKDDFNIKLDNQLLTISREIEEKKEEKNDKYTRREFVYGNFSRSFTLPKSINFDDISADYDEGILKVSLPKKEEEAKLSREIKIS